MTKLDKVKWKANSWTAKCGNVYLDIYPRRYSKGWKWIIGREYATCEFGEEDTIEAAKAAAEKAMEEL